MREQLPCLGWQERFVANVGFIWSHKKGVSEGRGGLEGQLFCAAKLQEPKYDSGRPCGA